MLGLDGIANIDEVNLQRRLRPNLSRSTKIENAPISNHAALNPNISLASPTVAGRRP